MNCHLWEFLYLQSCQVSMHFVTTSACLSKRSVFLFYMWRHITVAEGACWLWMVRDTEKCFMPEAAASETPIPAPPVKNLLARLAGKTAEKVFLGGVGIFFFKLLKKYEPLLGFPVRSLFLWSIFGIIWQCGLSDVWFWMGFWMWEVVTFWKRHSSIGQQTQVTSWESIWYDW